MTTLEAISPAPDSFWGGMKPGDHAVQIYREAPSLSLALEEFVAVGLSRNEGVIVIARPEHRATLEERLQQRGIWTPTVHATGQYIALDAAATLDKFMESGWPNAKHFHDLITPLVERARGPGRPVRAFGEMVALLWAQNYKGGAIRLEQLWNEVCQREKLALFCAYPQAGFGTNAEHEIQQVCSAHHHVLQD